MTKSDKGSEIAAIFNKATFKQRLEMRKGGVRMSGASLFLVVERKVGQCGRRVMKKTMTEDSPSWWGLVD